MNKFLTASMVAIVTAIAVPALAADMAPRYTKAPVAAPVVTYNWTGCYVGGNVGGAWARTDQTIVGFVTGIPFGPFDFGNSEGSNVVGGAQIGCDYQFAGNWVIGAQGMFDFGNVDSSHAIPVFPGNTPGFVSTNRTRDIFTATARLGYLFAPQVLGYVKGGGAWARVDYNVIQPNGLLSESASTTRDGWTVGGGLEWMFAPGWSVFGEYNYMDFGRKDIAFVQAPATVSPFGASIVSTRLTVNQALVGVNYKFNWGGPVVAKY